MATFEPSLGVPETLTAGERTVNPVGLALRFVAWQWLWDTIEEEFRRGHLSTCRLAAGESAEERVTAFGVPKLFWTPGGCNQALPVCRALYLHSRCASRRYLCAAFMFALSVCA